MQNHDGTIATAQQPKISQLDKILFCAFLGITFHAMVLFGVGFSIPELGDSNTTKSFNVVLAQYHSKEKPDKADFIGQADQQGGGESNEKLAPSAIEKAQFNDPNKTAQEVQLPPVVTKQNNTPEFLVSQHGESTANLKQDIVKEDSTHLPDTADLLQKSYQLSGLVANLDKEKITQAKRGKTRQISAAIHRSSDALYLDTWRRKIEKIGNLNYPEKAKRDKIYGNLTLKVAINQNGTINQVSIMKSSGKKILDDAAIRIVRLAAPFGPLSEEMKKDTDILEIIRVWQFEEDNQIRTG